MITNSTSLNAAIANGSSNVDASPIAAVGDIQASDNWTDGTVLLPFTVAAGRSVRERRSADASRHAECPTTTTATTTSRTASSTCEPTGTSAQDTGGITAVDLDIKGDVDAWRRHLCHRRRRA